jgi:hypothetical protein
MLLVTKLPTGTQTATKNPSARITHVRPDMKATTPIKPDTVKVKLVILVTETRVARKKPNVLVWHVATTIWQTPQKQMNIVEAQCVQSMMIAIAAVPKRNVLLARGM